MKKNPHAVALGQRGGKTTAKKKGSAYLRKIAAKGGKRAAKTKLDRYGPDFYSRIQRGEKPSQNHVG